MTHCRNMTIACCGPDTSSSNKGISPSPYPVLVSPSLSSGGLLRLMVAGDLKVTVRASPSSVSPLAHHSASTSHHLVFSDEFADSSERAGLSISPEAPADDRISIAASEDELGSGADDSAALPPSGRVALPKSDPELTPILSRAAESIGLHWRPPSSPEHSIPDD